MEIIIKIMPSNAIWTKYSPACYTRGTSKSSVYYFPSQINIASMKHKYEYIIPKLEANLDLWVHCGLFWQNVDQNKRRHYSNPPLSEILYLKENISWNMLPLVGIQNFLKKKSRKLNKSLKYWKITLPPEPLTRKINK